MASQVCNNQRWVINSSELRAPTAKEWDTYLGSQPVENEAQEKVRVRQSDALSTFFRSLSTMVSAGIHIERALTFLSQQHEDPAMAAVAQGLAGRVRTGMALSRAMLAYPRVFPEFHLRLIAVGERTGGMDRILFELAELEEKRRRNSARIRSALTYPAIVAALVMVMLAVLPGYVLSLFSDFLNGMGLEMPLIGRIFIGISEMLRNPWLYGGLALVAVAIQGPVRNWWESGKGRRLGWLICSYIPGVGSAMAGAAKVRFARALALQLKVGIRIDEALKASSFTAGNPLLAEKMPLALAAIMEGEETAVALAKTEIFDETFLSMVEVGGTTGSMPEMLSRTADVAEFDLERSLEMAFSLLEPLAMALMGLVVGGLVLSIIIPMSKLVESL